MSAGPGLSVIVAATWSAEAAGRTVASIGGGDGVEVIVVASPDLGPPGPSTGGVRWIAGDVRDVPRLRRIGADAARGAICAFLEDSCLVGPGWLRSVESAFRDGRALAATGPVEQAAGASAVDWGVYHAEYAPFAARSGRGVTPDVPRPGRRLAGINFACRREALGPSPAIREAEVAARCAGAIAVVDGMGVVHVRSYRWAEALGDRRRFGREFGRDRWSDTPGPLCRLGLAAAPAILGLQLARLVGCVATRPRLLGPLLRSSATTLALLTAWSAGEAEGWARAARAASRRRGRADRPVAATPGPPSSRRADCTRGPAPG